MAWLVPESELGEQQIAAKRMRSAVGWMQKLETELGCSVGQRGRRHCREQKVGRRLAVQLQPEGARSGLVW